MIEFPRLQPIGDTSFFFAVLCPKGINFRRQGRFSAHRAEGSGARLGNEGYQLREESASYAALFGAENDYIGPENTFFCGINNA